MNRNSNTIIRSLGNKAMAFVCILAAFLMAPALISCSDDDEIVKTPLDITSITEGAKTVSSLNFSWQAVNGAVQYAYELREKASGEIILGGMTNTTSLLATGLKTKTAYELTVWSYAAPDDDKTTSPKITLEATTNDVIVLATPSDVESQWNSGTITITWPEVPNAQGYAYQYEREGKTVSDTIQTNTLSIQALPVGEYTVFLRAISEDENYVSSESMTFSFKREKAEIWRTECNFLSAILNQNYTCQVVAYDDGNYEIEGLYGSDSRLEFNADENSEIVVLNAYKVTPPYYYVKAGDYTLCFYIDTECSSVELSRSSGNIWFFAYLYDKDNNYLGGDYESITWGETADGPSVDDLCGTYTETTSCYDLTIDFASWQAVTDATAEVTIEKVDDETVTIRNFYNWGADMTAKVDMENRTITFDNTSLIADYYYFADNSAQDSPVVATFDENYNITVNNWTFWYNSYGYIYEGATSTLVKR